MQPTRSNVQRFLQKFEKSLQALPSAQEMETNIRATTRRAKLIHEERHLRLPEAAFLNGYVIPALHVAICEEGLSREQARRALLNEYHRSLPQFSMDSPARTARHPFTKVLGAHPGEVYRRWADPENKSALVQSCPDFALRTPFPYNVLFEGKYYSKGSLKYAQQELVRDVYQAFFYLGLPRVEETSRGRAGWEYDYACLVAYDASPSGTLREAWEGLPRQVRDGLWDGANLYVMILGGSGR